MSNQSNQTKQIKKTVYLADYQPPIFKIETVDLVIDLFETHALVKNTMQVRRSAQGALCLDGDELVLEQICLDGQLLSASDYELNDKQLILTDCPDGFELEIVTRIFPQNNTALSGLFRSNGFFCTQCEAEGFRRMTYFLDRPDVLAVYTTRISADAAKYPILLSNGNLLDSGESDEGRHWALWHDPFKKPSYLFAVVAGDLACVRDEFSTMSNRKIDLRVYVEPHQADKAQHALDSLKSAMAWDEREYGREYDLDIYMIVAVSDFNMGAMENKGLNVFNAKYILARPDTATDQDYAGIESVVAHEYFHNWTGNRVTCRDWFQLSLKEGLTVFRDQEFSRDMNSRDVNRIQDVKVLRQAQFPEDKGRMAHPVRPPAYQEINNFYTATVYNKGAEVIRMLQTLLGKAGFRLGMDLYFERHDGEAVTIEDFVAAMADANQRDLSQFFHWYTQSGTPRVILTEQTYQNNQLILNFEQNGVKTPCPIPIEIALFDAAGEAILIENNKSAVLLLEDSAQEFSIDNLDKTPVHVSLLRGFSAPVMLEDNQSQAARLGILRVETDGFAKWDAAVRVVSAHVLKAYEAKARVALDEAVVDAFRAVLGDESLDMALRATLLTPPSFEEVVSELSDINVSEIEAARDAYAMSLGEALWPELSALYARLWAAEDHAMQGAAYARRQLRNMCLFFMMKARPLEAGGICKAQFDAAKTMTDQIASFGLLVNHPDEATRIEAIDAFYATWQSDDLVLDKWFALQASSVLPGALARVEALILHPAFDLKNPNKVRAVLGAFCQNNHRHFHAEDGSGYAFLSDKIKALDALNPQISARLATPFTRWQRFDATRQAAMQGELKHLSSTSLSADLREIVDKSLVDA
ncbi:MAG: aminopeptidase N [Gammaproteobacteria bacterium]|nr:aminopeptidase N [Gammaproteobacteria bacterium]MCH9716057.1 aminopeptidase N [Gammaproteobacteria bacterium]MCH9763083.1 aminopeptidase N [Gammaproteobacteria bacterium]